jgi:S1-C subfamily serine protease
VNGVKRPVVLLALALAMLLAGGCGGAIGARDRESELTLDRVLPSSVQVVLEHADGRRFRSGSAVVIAARSAPEGPDCFILTSAHTFAGAGRGKNVFVLTRRHEGPGVRTPATVLAMNDHGGVDLVLLGTRNEDCVVASMGRPARLGESVWVVSFPWGRELTVSRGVISQGRRATSGSGHPATAGRLMVDAPVSYGSSGGGVFRAGNGELIGLVEGYPTARVAFEGAASPGHVDVPVPGQTYLTPIGDAVEFLRGSGHGPLVAEGAPG